MARRSDNQLMYEVESMLMQFFHLASSTDNAEKKEPFNHYHECVVSWNQKPYVKPGSKLLTFSYIHSSHSNIWYFFPEDALFPIYNDLMTIFEEPVLVKRLLSHLSFNAGIQALFSSGKIYINTKSYPPLLKIIQSFKKDTFAIGLIPRKQKPYGYVALGRLGEDLQYFKIPVHPEMAIKAKRESDILNKLEVLVLEKIRHPYDIQVENEKLKDQVRTLCSPIWIRKSKKFKTIHAEAIAELTQKSLRQTNIESFPFYQRIAKYLKSVESKGKNLDRLDTPQFLKWQQIIERLAIVFGFIKPGDNIPCSISFGLFHRKRIFILPNQLLLLNWEEACLCRTVLYDLFDYIYHQNCCVYQRPFSKIIKEIDLATQEKAIENMVEKWDFSLSHCHLWYILEKIGEMCENEKYLENDELALHSLTVCKHALEYLLSSCNFSQKTDISESKLEALTWVS